MPENVVEYERRGAAAIIRLNRPEAGNTVNEAVMRRLESILEQVEGESNARAVILTGAGRKTFCAGGDFRYFATLDTRAKGLAMSLRMQAILDRLWSARLPVIAAINGKALGGGCEILTACHFRIASDEATFAFVQARNGITTGWGGAARLFHIVGRQEALRLLVTAEQFAAEEASKIRLVDRVVRPDEVVEAALEMAAKIARNSPGSISAFLELARIIYRGDTDALTKKETEIFADRWVSDEFRRAVAGFHDSRNRKPES
jgi:enoyl-CoA hydratase/carnithine racemase